MFSPFYFVDGTHWGLTYVTHGYTARKPWSWHARSTSEPAFPRIPQPHGESEGGTTVPSGQSPNVTWEWAGTPTLSLTGSGKDSPWPNPTEPQHPVLFYTLAFCVRHHVRAQFLGSKIAGWSIWFPSSSLFLEGCWCGTIAPCIFPLEGDESVAWGVRLSAAPFPGIIRLWWRGHWIKEVRPCQVVSCVSGNWEVWVLYPCNWGTQPPLFLCSANSNNLHIPAEGNYNARDVTAVKKNTKILKHKLKFFICLNTAEAEENSWRDTEEQSSGRSTLAAEGRRSAPAPSSAVSVLGLPVLLTGCGARPAHLIRQGC